MDIFVYNPLLEFNDDQTLLLRNASFIQDWTSLEWIERYEDPSEFTLKAPLESNLIEKLPLGSIVAQVNSAEFMMVENHEIEISKDKPSKLTVSGRSFEAFFENRSRSSSATGQLIGANSPSYVGAQVLRSKSAYIYTVGSFGNPKDYIEYLKICSFVEINNGISEYHMNRFGEGVTYKQARDVLKVSNAGIKTVRPYWTENPELDAPYVDDQTPYLQINWNNAPTPVDWPYDRTSPNAYIFIHRGFDRSNSVGFSAERGDIESADYFTSNKNHKNYVRVWAGTGGITTEPISNEDLVGYNLRRLDVFPQDLRDDESLTTEERAAASRNRARETLAAHRIKEISNVVIAPNLNQFKYRKDYNIGDLVGIEGHYGFSGVKRVIEYAEIQDQDGYTGTPTLANL